jgi:hypothetical protein
VSSFLSELKRRNVLRVAAAYAVVAWIIIEAGSVLLPTFGASESAFQIYVIVVLAGFLVSLVMAWVFEARRSPFCPSRAAARIRKTSSLPMASMTTC